VAPGFAGGDGGGEPVGVVAAGQGGADGPGPPSRPTDVSPAVVMRAAGASAAGHVAHVEPVTAGQQVRQAHAAGLITAVP